MPSRTAEAVKDAALRLRQQIDQLSFRQPVTHVYNPIDYAWDAHRQYIERFATGPRRVLFLGMNPGPWGMAQTGVPFGEVAAVRDWLRIRAQIQRPVLEHPKRPVHGLDCERSEVSGRRLWGLFKARFASPKDFFRNHFIANYCPLVFMEETARNRTPDKLPADERQPLEAACDQHLTDLIQTLRSEWVVGIGGFAEQRLGRVAPETVKVGRILHPSPASPAANRGWAEQAEKQLQEQGIW